MQLKTIKHALVQYYSEPLLKVFKQFRLGLVLFGIGIMGVIYTSTEMPPSLEQEITVFIFLIVTLIGFFIAMMAQIRMLITRILRFTRN